MSLSNRKHPYKWLWTLLFVALVIVFTLSCFDIPAISYTPKSSGMADTLFPQSNSAVADTTSAIDNQLVIHETDTTAQTLLFIGDSMLDGLSPRLAAYANASGHTLYSVVWYSSTTEIWGKSHRLTDYIKKISPTYIFICLGANELHVKDIEKERTGFVKELLTEIDTIPYIWIGPPNWIEDTGINKIIADNTAPGTYFKSQGMTFERRSDGAHPTAKSAIEWMDSVVRWMPGHSSHPIRLNMPDETTSRPARVFIHMPDEN